jgi:predicted RNase H-like nuclease
VSWVVGVDGCRAGWVAVVLQQGAWKLDVRLCSSFVAVLALRPSPAVVAVDIPIGLLETPMPGGRLCDRQARRLLGRRASSVFTPPSRDMLEATGYEEVRRRGMSRQAFGIMPKIREVDRVMTPALQRTVYEAHPELAFLSLTGHPLRYNKKTAAGHEERLRALARLPGLGTRYLKSVVARTLRDYKRIRIAPDDVLDACVLAWTARCILEARGKRLPDAPSIDTRGLRMEIWY